MSADDNMVGGDDDIVGSTSLQITDESGVVMSGPEVEEPNSPNQDQLVTNEELRYFSDQHESTEDYTSILLGATSDKYINEQDRFLPIANVARIMKRQIPTTGKVAKDAKECCQECVSEFIAFVTSEASERCQIEKRKTINGEDILFALQTLGFDNYLDPLKLYLARYRDALKGEKPPQNVVHDEVFGGEKSSADEHTMQLLQQAVNSGATVQLQVQGGPGAQQKFQQFPVMVLEGGQHVVPVGTTQGGIQFVQVQLPGQVTQTEAEEQSTSDSNNTQTDN